MKRFVISVLALLMVLALPPLGLAQPDPLPLPPPDAELINEWAVTLQAGANPDLVAAQLGMRNLGPVGSLPDVYRFALPNTTARGMRLDTTAALTALPEVRSATQQQLLYRYSRGVEDTITDPLFPNQWHLNNTGQLGGTVGQDARVFGAWNLGYTGSGIVVASVDDGVRHINPDIQPNYRADLSYDYIGNDTDPSGGGHGTAVAGVMAAAAQNTCGVGVAFNAQIAGIRMLGGPITDATEAASISHQRASIHVYNNSWGPSDDGRTLEGPGPLTLQAMESNVLYGRGGKGAITVWAAGNGTSNDNVNADGYANHRTVIAVGGSTNQGRTPWYAEPGAPILVNAPTNGGTAGIHTTGYSDTGCTVSFGGTSSAAPLVAGVVALMLEANPNLTWRDVQHILVRTAEKNHPAHADWQTNAAGFNINHTYGFGRVNAAAAVAMATTWTTVAPELNVALPTLTVSQPIPDAGAWQNVSLNFPHDLTAEHVEVVVNITHGRRGDLEIELISPHGTVSRLMYGRVSDTGTNFTNWRLSSVRHWGESTGGTWTLRVRDITAGIAGTLNSVQLRIYGTSNVSASSISLLDAPRWSANSLAPFKVVNPSKDQLVCSGNARTQPCAFRFIGSPTEAGVLRVRFPMNAYPTLPIATGGQWRLTGYSDLRGQSRVRIVFSVRYIDPLAWHEQFRMVLRQTSGWQPFQMTVPITRTDIRYIDIRFENLTKTNARAWLDDLDVFYDTVAASSGPLALPPAP